MANIKNESQELVKEIMIEDLKNFIEKYADLYEEEGVEDLILGTFNFEKPLTEIEIYKKNIEDVIKFLNELEEFFYVEFFNHSKSKNKFTGVIHISRFLSVIEVVKGFNHLQPYEDFTDLRGILFGYSLIEVAEFCVKNKSNDFDLVKL